MSLIPSCQDVQASLTEYMEGTLPLSKRLGIRLHLFLCHPCEGFMKALKSLPRLSRMILEAPAEPVPEAEHALGEALRRIKASECHDR